MPFPPPEALPRAVLVRNISPLATQAAIEDFFSFVCPIEKLRLRSVRSANGKDSSQEAVVVFTESRAKADAIVMDKSTIVDQPVTISAVPEDYDFNALPELNPEPNGFLNGFSGIGNLFNGVTSAVATEMQKAGKLIDDATETGVLKSAKDQVAVASQRTRDFAADIDGKWQVTSNVRNFAESSKANAALVANTVASQTKNVAQQVDSSLHLSEQTGKLAESARQNPTLNNSFVALRGGFMNLISQTGLSQPSGSQLPPGPSNESTTGSVSQNPSTSNSNAASDPQ
ncbi:RNA recognition motif [Gracilaria domingensis]|nr:RNA recognition motif [Gracilaria domingensis]